MNDKLQDTRGAIAQVFQNAQGDVTPAEYKAAQGAWRDAATMHDVHDTLERSFNGVPEWVAQQPDAPKRIQTGGTPAYKSLQRLLDKRPDDIERVIGKEGTTNLYRIADLLKKPDTASGAEDLVQALGMSARRHSYTIGAFMGGGAGAAAGAVLGPGGAKIGAGVGTAVGVPAEMATEYFYRRALHRLATDPEVNKRFAQAVQLKTTPALPQLC